MRVRVRVVVTGIVVSVVAACAVVDDRPPSAVEVAQSPVPAPTRSRWHRGVNFDHVGGFDRSMDARAVDRSLAVVVALGVTHVSITPSFFQQKLDSTEFFWTGDRQRVDGEVRDAIRLAHRHGLAVLLKPHLWLRETEGGAWRGQIDPADGDWPGWRDGYRDVLLSYARLAAEEGVAGLSIGSELTALAVGRPAFWRSLAADVRAVFPGFLTYASNWHEEAERIVWWRAVDYIGVDGFWPITTGDQILTDEIADQRLGEIRELLARLGTDNERPVLLTEIGLKSAHGGGVRPWEWHDLENDRVDLELQTTFYRAMARQFPPGEGERDTDGVAGLYLWKWYADLDWGGRSNSDFTPRGKPAEDVIGSWFGGG